MLCMLLTRIQKCYLLKIIPRNIYICLVPITITPKMATKTPTPRSYLVKCKQKKLLRVGIFILLYKYQIYDRITKSLPATSNMVLISSLIFDKGFAKVLYFPYNILK